MSKVVDERVVEMQFNNANFESNVKTTMSTLDRLKAALKFPKNTDTLSSLSSGAKNLSSGMGVASKAVQTLHANFSALQVVGVAALANITNQAVNAGKRIANAITLEPLTSGFKEYETQMNAVQTIMSNTRSKGTTIDQVNAALDELNTYADKTIYNFTEMTRNIGTFTAAGVGLEESVSAIKGIANLAAVSGSSSTQASTAMYQLSQALAAGRVSLMDWNSVVNAGMGGEVFQEALKRTARVMGTGVDEAIEKYGTFRESLTQGQWLTTEVLTETLGQIAGAYSDTQLKSKGYTDEQIKDIQALATDAEDAATKVKTFTQLIDTLMEALGSGWTNTWEAIFGDFYEARDFWTGMSDALGELIGASAEARNALFGDAFDSPWEKLTEQIEAAGGSMDVYQQKITDVAKEHGIALDTMINDETTLLDLIQNGTVGPDILVEAIGRMADEASGTSASIGDMTDKLEYFQKVVSEVWRGDFGNGAERIKKLTDAGYDYATVQSLVNKTVDQHKLTLEDLSDVELKAIGYTDEQIEALNDLKKQASESGTELNDLIQKMSMPSGRTLFLEGLRNTILGLIKPFQAFGKAWDSVFSIDSGMIYDLVKAFNDFSKALNIDTESDTFNDLVSTFQGLLSVAKLVIRFVGGGLKAAFDAVVGPVGDFGGGVLETTAWLGDMITEFERSLDSTNLFLDVVTGISDALNDATKPMSDFFNQFKDLPVVSETLKAFSDQFEKFTEYLDSFKDLSVQEIFEKLYNDITDLVDNFNWDDFIASIYDVNEKVTGLFASIGQKMAELGPDIWAGFQNGLMDGAQKIFSTAADIAEKVIEVAKAVLGIHSPSTEFYTIGQNVVQGFINGVRDFFSGAINVVFELGQMIANALKDVDWGAVFVVSFAGMSFAGIFKFLDVMDQFAKAANNLTAPAKSLGQVFDGVRGVFKSLEGYVNAKKATVFADAMMTVALAIAVLVAALIVLGQQDIEVLKKGGIALGGLAAGLVIASVALSKLADSADFDGVKVAAMATGLGIAIIAIAGAFAIIGNLSTDGFNRAVSAIVLMGVVIAALIGMTKYSGNVGQIEQLSAFMTKVGVAFLLMGVSVRLMAGIDSSSMGSVYGAIIAFGAVCAALIGLSRYGKKMDKVGDFVRNVGVAFLAVAVAAKLIGGMSFDELSKAMAMLVVFGIVIGLLVALSQYAGGAVKKAGDFVLKVSAAFAVLGIAIKILGNLSQQEIDNGLAAITKFYGVIIALMLISNFGGQMAKIGTTILAMSIAIGILAAVAVLLGHVDEAGLERGVKAVTIFGILVAAMAQSTRGASDVKGTMIGIAVAIGVMAAAVAVLSFIDPERLAPATLAMMGLMGMFALIAKNASYVQGAWKTIGVLVIAVAALAGILALISLLNPESALPNALGLSAMLLALAAACRILDGIKDFDAGTVLIAMSALAVVMLEITGIMALLQNINPNTAIPNLVAVGVMLAEMAVIATVMSKVGVSAAGAAQAATGLIAFIGIVGTVLTATGAVIDQLGAAESIINSLGTMGDVMQALGTALGQLVGGFIGGILEGATSTLPQVAIQLSQFMVNLMPFLMGMKMLDPSVLTSAQTLADVIGTLAGAGLVNAFAQIFGSGMGLATFSLQLPLLGIGIRGFAMALKGVNTEDLEVGAKAAGSLAELANALPKEGGWAQTIFGSSTGMDDFGDQLEDFGEGLMKYAKAVSGIEAYQASLDASVTAGKALSDLANALPKSTEGSLIGSILGTNAGLDTFAEDIKDFGKGLMEYGAAVQGIEDYTGSMEAAVNAGYALNDLASALGNDGGDSLVTMIFGGKNTLADFGTQLSEFGSAILAFSQTTATVNTERISTLTGAINTLMRTLKANLGETDYSTAITNIGKITTLGASLKDFYDSLEGASTHDIASATSSIERLVSVIESMADMNTSGISIFESAISELSSVSTQRVTDAFGAIDLSGIGTTVMSTFANGLSSSSGEVSAQVEYVTDQITEVLISKQRVFERYGNASVENFASGMENEASTASEAAIVVTDAAVSAFSTASSEFYSAGSYAAQGFANGISSSAYRATIAARAMADAAKRAAQAALDENSPSKVFYGIGAYAGEGFVNALHDYAGASAKAGRDFSESAIDGAKRSISNITDIINSGVDLNPTITPVVDLSDVKAGAAYINGAFGGASSFSFGQAGAIARGLSTRSQNGTLSDVVQGISKLRRDIQAMPVNQYNVGGITYDDGTNVANAVRDLIHATRVEGRK